MGPVDITNITISLWQAFAAAAGVMVALAGVMVWAFVTFEGKEDARSRKNDTEDRHKSLEVRVTAQDGLLQSVAKDVSYIRGAMESKLWQKEKT